MKKNNTETEDESIISIIFNPELCGYLGLFILIGDFVIYGLFHKIISKNSGLFKTLTDGALFVAYALILWGFVGGIISLFTGKNESSMTSICINGALLAFAAFMLTFVI